MLKENEEQIFKIVKNENGKLFSMFAYNFAKIEYKIGEFVSPPKELLEIQNGLFCFTALKDAIAEMRLQDDPFSNLEIYSGIGLNRISRIINWYPMTDLKVYLEYYKNNQSQEEVFLELYPNGVNWGKNHRVFEQIKLLEKISEEEIQKVIEDSGRTPKSRKDSA